MFESVPKDFHEDMPPAVRDVYLRDSLIEKLEVLLDALHEHLVVSDQMSFNDPEYEDTTDRM